MLEKSKIEELTDDEIDDEIDDEYVDEYDYLEALLFFTDEYDSFFIFW